MAFYSSWHKVGLPYIDQQFWVNANSNFLDIALLEWCKLYTDERGKHYFAKVVTDSAGFKMELLAELAITDISFNECAQQVRTYRDKFVAHLDEINEAQIPELTIVKESTIFLYEYLIIQEAGHDTFHDAPKSSKRFYNDFIAQGEAVYAK